MTDTTSQSAADQARNKTAEATDKVQDKTAEAKDKVQDAGRQASEQARERVKDMVDQRSTDAGQQVASTADALRQTASQLREKGTSAPANVIESLADRIEGVGSWLRDSDGDQILHDIENFGRRQPNAIMFSGLALGFAASRVLRASSTRRYESSPRYGRQLPQTAGGSAVPTPGYGAAGTPGYETGVVTGSPTSGLTAEGGTTSTPTTRTGLESDAARERARGQGTPPPESSPTGGV